MEEAEKSLQAYDTLLESVPSIGFLSRTKRIKAYLKVTETAQKLIDAEEINEEEALFMLSILSRKHGAFQKAVMMTALNLPKIDKKVLTPIGFRYVNEFRASLQMTPVEQDSADS